MRDLLLYMTQNAFRRRAHQENNKLTKLNTDWMQKHKDVQMESASILGLIERKTPTYRDYNLIQVAGASRAAMAKRIIDLEWIRE